jgi:hypothetical protein
MTTQVLVPPPVFERRAVTVKNKVQCKQDQIVMWLQEFYSNTAIIEKLLPILQGKNAISLRLVDYFVTNYAKKMNTSYMWNEKHFLVYFNYKRELNAYSKRLFDPFCRRERIMFEARGQTPFMTTVGQLNFFRWFLEKGICDYMTEHREEIEKDMNATLKNHYSRTASTVSTNVDKVATDSTNSTLSTASTKQRKKRCELTESAMKKVNVHECEVVVSFS